MDRKKFLLGAVFSLILIGLFGAMVPFVSSLSPNIKAEAALVRLDISKIQNGQFKTIQAHPIYGDTRRGFKWGLMIYKKYNGELRVWDIAIKTNGDFGLPDRHWFNPYWPCASFGPSLTSGLVNESLPIMCRDQRSDDSWGQWMQWDIDGKAISKHTPDMHRTKGSIEGKYFVFNKSS
jgi:hypothetical protein